MSEHLRVSNQEFFDLHQKYVERRGCGFRRSEIEAVKLHLEHSHSRLNHEERIVQTASHQFALMRGEVDLADLLPKTFYDPTQL